jgi:hypothetical protein
MGYEELTIDASTVRPTSALVEVCRFAIMEFSGGSCRFREDGTAPTAAIGTPCFDLQQRTFSQASLRQLRFTRTGTLNATARVRYFA